MDSKRSPVVTLPSKVIRRCLIHGCNIVDAYRKGLNGNSLAVSSHGAEHDPFLQAQAKMGECAFCLWAGLSCDVLKWNNRADSGFDVVVGSVRIDVKTIEMGRRFLIWPVNKRGFFHEKIFDAFVLVKAELPSFTIAGHISKDAFFEQRQVACANHLLDEGTWYVEDSELLGMDEFGTTLPGSVHDAIRTGRQFEFISKQARR